MAPAFSALSKLVADQRQQVRYAVRWKATIIWTEENRQYRVDGRTADLSLHGAAVHCEYNLILPQSCTMLLSMPALSRESQPEMVEIKCQYVYTVCQATARLFRIGLTFLSIDGDRHKALQQRLGQHLPFSG